MASLASRIRTARKEAGLTQEELADICSVSRAAVSLWESEDQVSGTKPRYKKLQLIAEHTNKSVQWFLDAEIADSQQETVVLHRGAIPDNTEIVEGAPTEAEIELGFEYLSPEDFTELVSRYAPKANLTDEQRSRIAKALFSEG